MSFATIKVARTARRSVRQDALPGQGSLMPLIAQLFDKLIEELGLSNDSALAELLEVDPPKISRLRRGHSDISPAMLLKVHEISGWEIRVIKGVLGMPCLKEKILR